jgi:hypothetical protein
MAYNEHLADCVRTAISAHAPATERAMFGGLALMIDGHMTCGSSAMSSCFASAPTPPIPR